MSKLAGKVAIVTGASKGMGADIAKGLAKEGASVVVNYSSSKEGADKVVAEITTAGGKALAVQGTSPTKVMSIASSPRPSKSSANSTSSSTTPVSVSLRLSKMSASNCTADSSIPTFSVCSSPPARR
jgi:hypothetical protein